VIFVESPNHLLVLTFAWMGLIVLINLFVLFFIMGVF